MCKEQVKFSLLSRDEPRRGVTNNPCGTVQTSPSCSEQAAMSTQPEAVPCRDGRSRARGSVATFSWCPGRGFSSRSHGWVRGRQCLVGWARGSAAAWEVCAAAQTPLLHRQAFPLLPAVRLALLCFTPLISTNFVLKFIWPRKRVYIFLDPLAAFKRLDEHLCCGTCSTKLSGALGSAFGLLPAALGQCWASGLPNLLGFLSLRLDFNGFYTERLEHMSAERSQKAAPLLPRLAVPAQWSPAVAPFSHPPPFLHQQRTGHSLTSN